MEFNYDPVTGYLSYGGYLISGNTQFEDDDGSYEAEDPTSLSLEEELNTSGYVPLVCNVDVANNYQLSCSLEGYPTYSVLQVAYEGSGFVLEIGTQLYQTPITLVADVGTDT